jgi:prepilin-type N-terminal cleavage/methylation domain-containing protein
LEQNRGFAALDMKIDCTAKDSACASGSGFTLPETLVAVAILGICFSSLFTAITMGVMLMRTAREGQRATQLEVEKFEEIRLYNWDQINSNGFIPSTFTASFDPTSTNGGLVYNGTVSITNAPITGSYSNDLKLVTVQLTWNSGNTVITQSMASLVAHYGMQNYIY